MTKRILRRDFIASSGAAITVVLLPSCTKPQLIDTGGVPVGSTGTTTTAPTTTETDLGTPTETTDCPETQSDIEGPFYISDAPVRSDLDVHDDAGTKLFVSGSVVDGLCVPIANAVIEVWHADPAALYDDSAQMRYRGQFATDKDGNYAFSSLVPGHYLNDGQYRPAHLHIKIWVKGNEVLTTQLYFSGDKYNKDDPWYSVEKEMTMTKDAKNDAWTSEFTFSVNS